MPAAIDGTPTPEGVKIRHYIVSLIYSHPGEAYRIPGSAELAAMFGVARSTVTLALKELTGQGLIIGRRGIGTFTNPASSYLSPEPDRAVPLIGMLAGDGRMFYYEHYTWSMLSRIGLGLTPHPCNIRFLTEGASDPDEISGDLRRISMDGLVWVMPPEEYAGIPARLSAEGMPVVTVEQLVPGVSGAMFDFEETGCRIGKLLLAEGRHTVAVVLSHSATRRQEEGMLRAAGEAGAELELIRFTRPGDGPALREFGERVRGGWVPDAVYAHGLYICQVQKLFRELGIDTRNRCRLIANRHSLVEPGFCGIVFTHPEEEHAAAAAGLLLKRLEEPGSPPEHCLIPCDVSLIL